MNDKHNVEEFLKELSCLSRKYGLIIEEDLSGSVTYWPMREVDRKPEWGYVQGKRGEIKWGVGNG